jgi:hypothetical protein
MSPDDAVKRETRVFTFLTFAGAAEADVVGLGCHRPVARLTIPGREGGRPGCRAAGRNRWAGRMPTEWKRASADSGGDVNGNGKRRGARGAQLGVFGEAIGRIGKARRDGASRKGRATAAFGSGSAGDEEGKARRGWRGRHGPLDSARDGERASERAIFAFFLRLI